jgi:hypothetical protein
LGPPDKCGRSAHIFGVTTPTANSASGGFVRQVPRLLVIPAVETVEKVPFQKLVFGKGAKILNSASFFVF